MTYIVSGGALNSTHLLTYFLDGVHEPLGSAGLQLNRFVLTATD